jgi:hypothetical protein
MKKLLSGLVAILLFLPITVLAAGRSTMTLSPTQVSVRAGETFDVTVNINPNGASLNTARAILTFSPTLLKVEEAVLTGAFDHVSPGNGMDDGKGVLSFGGFRLGDPVTQSTAYARVTFQARQEGKAVIEVSPSSRLIENGEEKIDGKLTGNVSVAIGKKDERVPEVIKLESSTHPGPEVWQKVPVAELAWSVEGADAQVTDYQYALDQNSATEPTQTISKETTTYTTKELNDGLWYFHFKARLANGKSTQTLHRKIKIDRTPPNPFVIDLVSNQVIENETTQAFFGTTDETSGVAWYELSMNESPFTTVSSPQTFSNLPPGTYILQVRAIDQAGNQTYDQKTLRSYPEGTELPTRPVTLEERKQVFGEREKLLITLALGLIIISGIIYKSKMKKKKF